MPIPNSSAHLCKKEKGKSVPTIPHIAKAFVREAFVNGLYSDGNFVTMQPETVREVFPLLQERFHILSAGINVGEIKGKDLIPAQELALSTAFNPDAFPFVELTWEEAIKFLKKEVLLLHHKTICHKYSKIYQATPYRITNFIV